MNRKKSNEKVAKFIGECAKKIRIELENELIYAQRNMFDAETKLLNGLTEEQKQLYAEILEYQKVCQRIKKELGKD